MGQGWRRVTEAVRQKVGMVGIADKEFVATSNGRNEAMFKEASDFAVHMRTMEKDLLSLQKLVDGQFTNMRNILVSTLPRAYTEGVNGPEPIEDAVRLIGQGMNADKIIAAAQELKTRLESEVLQPVKEWMAAYRRIQADMKVLEALRLELDSRRRTVGNLDQKLTQQKMKTMRRAEALRSGGGGGMQEESKLREAMAETEKTKERKESKLSHTKQQFEERETMVYNSLFTLVNDTAVFRDYAAAYLQIVQDCYAMAHSAFDGTNPVEFSTTAAPGFGMNAAAPQAKGSKTIMRTLADKMRLTKADDYPPARENDAPGRPFDQVYGFDAAAMGPPSGKIAPPTAMPEHDMHGHPYMSRGPAGAYVPSPSTRYAAPQHQTAWGRTTDGY
mmetsp:Transcript_22125/g.48307  ORF Transcript_22125/g.48307 Transcript_22125/m.48307 type:complete len:388 (+) Transcript_22125:179-1342(+)|eukprot:CAMPEP_0202894658 /NCGR_PEP_ID=MMETSP1392-20130828/4013_1 /ASSEMBLY_ACC=CAM_ASM_000868 /TAXON_ID=225041 /ORGANISM="Chlamydomonas chlamydogama, Strain SAG 11-48b" /LENGTH=387 /DNA_ID=CAMNT_0049579417 /DNA_START=160 /DNA_END=1323 /DNA_ORIENTATION=-